MVVMGPIIVIKACDEVFIITYISLFYILAGISSGVGSLIICHASYKILKLRIIKKNVYARMSGTENASFTSGRMLAS